MKWLSFVIFLTLISVVAVARTTVQCVQNALRPEQTFASRHAAFRAAKWDARIPMIRKPLKITKVPLTNAYGKPALNRNGQIIMTREYLYKNLDGKLVIIQDHSMGHSFSDGAVGSHFNVRPSSDTRHGVVPGTLPHYSFH
jgi:hypothetical protein